MSKAFFEREYSCPICLANFTSLTVRSSAIYVEKRESDFHNIYKGVSPLHYSIIVCPECEYAASNTTFNNELNRTMADQLAIALVKLKSPEHIDYSEERTLETALEAFKLAIITAQLKKSKPEELSGLFLAAAWVARESHNSKLEEVYIEQALHQYIEAFNHTSGKIGNLSDLQVTYLIGELYRRSGDYKTAINWFNKVISHKNVKQNPNIEKLTREQWALAREEAKNITEDSEVKEIISPITEATSPSLEEENTAEEVVEIIRRRSTMQFSANLYPDQIEWLKTISNYGHKNTNKLFPRENVLRALIDFAIAELGDKLPTKFTTEEELISELQEIMKKDL
ncbi:MAG: DUF2225 domain-containing protein [Syntrophomonadaceae bacterium]|nr:DUF2225 domain-containing protein [Syntrophomonadaceae bacterium]